jgi:hypothetical protein
MANELFARYDSGFSVYAVLQRNGQIWNGTALVAIETDDWATYDIPLTEQDGSGLYYANEPSGLSAGTYDVLYFERLGATPATTDDQIAGGTLTVGYSPSAPEEGWTTAEEVVDILALEGVTATADAVTPFLNEAIDDFQDQTERRPFLQESSSTKRYDPPDTRDGRNQIRLPDYTAITAVVVNYSSTYAGDTLTEEEDFDFIRWKKGDDSSPIVGIDFYASCGSTPRSVRVTGTRGVTATLQSNVRQGVAKGAAARYLVSIQGQQGAVTRKKIADREEEYDTTSGRDTVSRLDAAFKAVVAKNRRVF